MIDLNENNLINQGKSTVLSFEAIGLSCIRDDRTLFSNLSFSLEKGQMLLVEGENGSGKTSLLRIISGIRLADEGQIHFHRSAEEKNSLISSSDHYEGEVAYLGHHDGNKLDLTVLENLQFISSINSAGNSDLSMALETVGLKHFEDQLVSNLSAGQRRRIALARILISGAAVWILDEPFTALDTKGIKMVESIIMQQLEKNGIVIMTSHHSLTLKSDAVKRINLSE